MTTLADLQEQRDIKHKEMQAILATCDAEKRDLDDAEHKKFYALDAEFESLEKRIDRRKKLDEIDRRMQGQALHGPTDQHLDADLRQFSIVKALAGAAGMNIDWGRERELQPELAKRAGKPAQGVHIPTQVFEERVLTTTAPAGGPGSNLISTDHLGNQFIDRLRAALVIRQLGARVLNGLTGNVEIPKLKASGASGWVAENAALSSSDHQFEKVGMTPKHAGALTEFSRNMLQQTSPDIESLVRADFAAILAEAVDRAAIQGGGADEPNGILQTSGVAETAYATDYQTTAANMIGALDVSNVSTSRAFLASNSLRADILKQNDGDGLPKPVSAQFHNEPVTFNGLLPTDLGAGNDEAAIIYGDFSDVLIGYWSAFDILVNPYETNAYSKGNILVRAMLTCDVAVRHPQSFTFTSVAPA
jgi:HK97 family phage major capsid protein